MKYSSDESYIYYLGSNVPVNALGIRDPKEIEELETQLFLKAYKYFHKDLDKKTIFDQKYLKAINRFGFSKLYSWAGKYRTVNISKNNTVFCQAIYLQDQADILFAKLKKDNYLKDYMNKTPAEFAKKIAYYMCELIAIHPFCELNGRTIRLFFDMIAVYNGYEYINYEIAAEKKSNPFIKASVACMNGNCIPMQKIILKGLKKYPGNL